MKNLVSFSRSVFLLAGLAAVPLTAHAQLTWGSSGTGGGGTWNAVNTNWYDGVSDVVWNSGTATFAGTAGTVTVSGTQSASDLRFVTGGYTFNGGTINLTGTPTITGLATINSTLQGTNGVTFINGSKTIGGNNVDLDGIINIAGTGTSFTAARIASNNALGDSGAFADRVILTQGAQGASLQLNAGVILPKYLTTVGTTTIETITGNTGLTGNFVPGGTVLFSLAANTQLTLSGNAGLGQSGSSLQANGSGRLIVDAAAGATAYGLFIRNSAAVQVNSGATLGAANVFFDGASGNTTLALNGSTVANNIFVGAATSAKIENMAAGSSTLSGQILANGADFGVMLRSTTSGTLNVSAQIADSSFTGTVAIGNGTFANAGTVNFSRAAGNTYDGGTAVNSGTLLLNNTSNSATGTGAVVVNSGAALGGTGLATGAVTVNSGGTLSPGNSAGIISVGSLTLSSGSLFDLEINGLTAGTLYDQANVTGTVTLAGNMDITLGFTPAEFDNFFIINNDGTDAVTGQLNGLAQGASFNLGGYAWMISYQGDFGSNSFLGGNDVVIQAVPEPSTALLLGLGLTISLFGLRRRTSLRA